MVKPFPPTRDFKSLSIKDLLDAREAYHSHLAHIENVVATAIGLYRIREDDPDAVEPKDRNQWRNRKNAPARTLQNTVVRSWSWPCVLAFVNKWSSQEEIAEQDPDQFVPRFLYLPDGRVVPTCVILAERQQDTPPPLRDLTFPSELVGGGYPVLATVQGQEHIGSIGCLVTDGHQVYALTNRHVTGEEGAEIFTFFGGERRRIGKSHKSLLRKKSFQDVYPSWPGMHTSCNLDAGLICVEDINYWTAQVFGIGELDDPVDLNTDTISLDLIGCPVRAFGAASGELVGEIQALFYRYKSIGGVEYISDLLIGARGKEKLLGTLPGDSGTVWFYDDQDRPEKASRARRLHPLALQWGGHVLLSGRGEAKLQFALATCLSTICRELDVDLVRDWNTGLSEYWGKTGHYKIAASACHAVADQKLQDLLLQNLGVIAFDDQAIEAGQLRKINATQFVPLADVADLVWRSTRQKDAASHFADMDQEGLGDFAGQTLLDLCKEPANLSPDVWNRFYDSLRVEPKDRGALPFRVWQIYDQLVQFVKVGRIAEFICAGGILSHYVADACIPLHISQFHHGQPGMGQEQVHSKYETDMLDRFAADIIAGVNQELSDCSAEPSIQDGKAAAFAVVQLMRNTITMLPPLQVIQVFDEAQGTQRVPYMWSVLGQRTISCLAAGALCMASLWASAWKQAGGSQIPSDELGPVDRDVLRALYMDKGFLPAFRLTDPEFAATLGG